MSKGNLYLKTFSELQWEKLLSLFWIPINGLYQGLKSKTLPIDLLLLVASILTLCHGLKLDFLLLRRLHLESVYPTNLFPHLIYLFILFWLPFLFWTYFDEARRQRFKKRVEETLITAGLRNPLGKTPQVVGLYSIDQDTKKLVLTKASFSLHDFVTNKLRLESGLHSFIDDIKEQRTKGLVEILFSSESLPISVSYVNPAGKRSFSFFIGSTRTNEVIGDLDKTPHLLVAGQTGGGKSTFLRNFITTQFLNSKNVRMTLIDLKGGLEFQLFEDLPRVEVIPNLEKAIDELTAAQSELIHRIENLKRLKAKDISKMESDSNTKSFLSNRHLIVVDEGAELFLAGGGSDAQKIIQARRILSLIARQGRAVGIHLVIATQRPDSRSLDPQVKANLAWVLCFAMQNDSSSITVLGNGRATDLPLIPGRAIWKEGPLMIEVQTPYLSVDEADKLLEPHRIPRKEKHEAKLSQRH